MLRSISPILPDKLEGNPKAVLCRAAGPEKQELVGSVMGSRTRLARAFGKTPDTLLAEIQRRLKTKPEIVEVSRGEAPCQQVVLTGDDADLTKLPVHLQHGADGAPYISSSIDYVIDPKTGCTNVGLRRMMLRGRQEAGIDLVAPSDLRAIYEATRGAGQEAARQFRGRRAPDRSCRGHHAAADRRARHRRLAARRAAAGGEVRHQRHPCAGRRRIRVGGLSRRARPRRTRRTVWRVPRLLRRGEAQPGVPSRPLSRGARMRCSRLRPSAAARWAAPTPRSSRRCAPR